MAQPPRHTIDDWLVPVEHEDDDETAATVLMNDGARQALLAEDARTPPALESRFEDEALMEEPEGSLAGEVAPAEVEPTAQATPVLLLALAALALVATAIAIAPLLLL